MPFDSLIFPRNLFFLNDSPWRQRLLETTRGQILTLLRTRDSTVEDIATQLQLTDNAVRAILSVCNGTDWSHEQAPARAHENRMSFMLSPPRSNRFSQSLMGHCSIWY